MLKAIYSEAGNLGPFRDDIPAYWDWMPHDIAMILDLTGEKPVHVTARKIEREQTKHGAGETTELIMKFKSGLESVTRVTNLRLPKTRLFAVQTDNSAIRYDGIGDPSLIDISKISSEKQLLTSPGVRIPVSGPQPLEILLSEFTDAVLTRNTANESLDLACRVIEVLADGWSQLIARP
jgi:predicted dehydrogenase